MFHDLPDFDSQFSLSFRSSFFSSSFSVSFLLDLSCCFHQIQALNSVMEPVAFCESSLVSKTKWYCLITLVWLWKNITEKIFFWSTDLVLDYDPKYLWIFSFHNISFVICWQAALYEIYFFIIYWYAPWDKLIFISLFLMLWRFDILFHMLLLAIVKYFVASLGHIKTCVFPCVLVHFSCFLYHWLVDVIFFFVIICFFNQLTRIFSVIFNCYSWMICVFLCYF